MHQQEKGRTCWQDFSLLQNFYIPASRLLMELSEKRKKKDPLNLLMAKFHLRIYASKLLMFPSQYQLQKRRKSLHL